MHSKNPLRQCWTTQKEVDYIDSIGTHHECSLEVNTPTQQDFLKGYIEGAKKRVNWGAVDSVIAIHHAEAVLAACAV